MNAQGTTIGTFYGDETTTENGYGHINEAIVVTQDVMNTSNDPAVGSVFDTAPHGFGGELLYTDLVGQGTGGTDKITESVLSASGAILRNIHQTYDFSALFHGDAFQAYAEPAASADVVCCCRPDSSGKRRPGGGRPRRHATARHVPPPRSGGDLLDRPVLSRPNRQAGQTHPRPACLMIYQVCHI